MANVEMAQMAQSRRLTMQDMQRAFRQYRVMELDGDYGLFPTNCRVQGNEMLLHPLDVPIDRYGTPIDLTTTSMVDPLELERIFQWRFGGKWALVRLGVLSWFDPETAVLKLTAPLDATHMQVQILWNPECRGTNSLMRGNKPSWMCYRYRHTCKNDPRQGSDFYMIDLCSPILWDRSDLEDFQLRLAEGYEKRMNRCYIGV